MKIRHSSQESYLGRTALFIILSLFFITSAQADHLLVAETDSGGSGDGIFRYDLSGSNRTVFLGPSEASHPSALAYSAATARLYWAERFTGKIKSANRNGSDVLTLITLSGSPSIRGIAVDDARGVLFFTDATDGENGNGAIYKVNLNGSGGPTAVVTGITNPNKIAVSANGLTIYWAENRSGGGIISANTTGTNNNVQTITLHTNTASVALDTTTSKLYAGAVDGTVDRSDSDGSNIATLATLVGTVQEITLLPTTAATSAYVIFGTKLGSLVLNTGAVSEIIPSGLIEPSAVIRLESNDPTPMPTPTATPSPTLTATNTPTVVATGTPISTPTSIPTSTPTTVATSSPTPLGTPIRNAEYLRVFASVSDLSGTRSQIVALDLGGDAKTLATQDTVNGPVTAMGVSFSEKRQRLFWVERDTGFIKSIGADGANIETVAKIPNAQTLRAIDVDDARDQIVVSDFLSGVIYLLNVDGSNLRVVATGRQFPFGVGVSRKGVIHWVESVADGGIYRAIESGSGYAIEKTASRSGPTAILPVRSSSELPEGSDLFFVGTTSGEVFLYYPESQVLSKLGIYRSEGIQAMGAVNNVANPSFSNFRSMFFAASQSKVLSHYIFHSTTTLKSFEDTFTATGVAAAFAEFPLVAPTPSPTPSKPSPPGRFNIIGRVGAQEGGSGSVKAVTVYLQPLDPGPAAFASGDVSLPVYQSTTTDADGRYLFTGVPQGSYELVFDRPDLVFLSNTLSVKIPGEVAPNFAQPAELNDSGCTRRITAPQIAQADQLALKMAKHSLQFVDELERRGGKVLKGSERIKYLQGIGRFRVRVQRDLGGILAASKKLPKLILQCPKTRACSVVTYSREIKRYLLDVKRMVTLVDGVARMGVNRVGDTVKPLTEKKLSTLISLNSRIGKVSLRFPKRSATCLGK